MSTALEERLDRTPVWQLLVWIAFVALAVRLVLLGDRIAHWDEGRVAYWILYYQETGHFTYRSIIHGPWIQHANRWLFPITGANDFTMRLPVAVVGAALPLSAYLFREHLSKYEVVGTALFLAFNPILWYYSRFMRSDVLVAAFMFVGFGLLVRYYDTRRWRYVYGAALFVGMGIASKENALVYLVTWAGGVAVLLVQAVVFHRGHRSVRAYLGSKYRGAVGVTTRHKSWVIDRVVDYFFHLTFVSIFLGLVLLFFFAPRGAGEQGLLHPPETSEAPGLWAAVANPGEFVSLVERTRTHGVSEFSSWINKAEGKDNPWESYKNFLGILTEALATKAAPLVALAVVGFGGEWLRESKIRGILSTVTRGSAKGAVALIRSTRDAANWAAHGVATAVRGIEDSTGVDMGSTVERTETGARRFSETTEGYSRTAASRVSRVGRRVDERLSDTDLPPARGLITFAFAVGVASLIGYPAGMDISAGWIATHVVVPLSIPAGVGLAKFYDWGRSARAADDVLSLRVVAVVAFLVVANFAVVGVGTAFVEDQSHSNPLVQYAQPGGELRPEVKAMSTVAERNQGETDVLLFYGMQGNSYDENVAFVENHTSDWDSSYYNRRPLCAKWFNTLPFPWYWEKDDVQVDCSRTRENLTARIQSNPPPMVITQNEDPLVPTDALDREYEPREYAIRAHESTIQKKVTTFWVHEDWRSARPGSGEDS